MTKRAFSLMRSSIPLRPIMKYFDCFNDQNTDNMLNVFQSIIMFGYVENENIFNKQTRKWTTSIVITLLHTSQCTENCFKSDQWLYLPNIFSSKEKTHFEFLNPFSKWHIPVYYTIWKMFFSYYSKTFRCAIKYK